MVAEPAPAICGWSDSREKRLLAETTLDGWQDVPIRMIVVGKVKQLLANGTSVLVDVSGAVFVATFDPMSTGPLIVGSDVLIDEDYESILGIQ
jgi:hypothetical protein